MIRLPEDPSMAPVTEPEGAGVTSGESAVTVHYAEQLPAEVLREAGMRSPAPSSTSAPDRAPSSSSDRTMAMVNRPGVFSPPSALSAEPTPRTSAPLAPSRWAAAIAILALGVVLGVTLGSVVAARVAQRQSVPEAGSPNPPR